ncbi:MAG: methylmalonyl Co-A mutase-associated GTPase MeaB [Deltaproteobacteria bacterium]|nr:methylmalonyl Co-A mutase-associated GTPase MeaB [Deltaproteobacteria bacterium]
MEWIERLLQGDHYAASKLISMVENKSPLVPEIMKSIYPHTGKARTLGFTGPPGVGKSTLVDQIIYMACAKGLRVGVIAVDSSSPFTGGALLGDRIRMRDYAENDDVFIRSMGTRGHLGGLSEASKGAKRILDALGCDLILVETVGVGQIELDIVKEVDTVLVATMPSTGDYVQTMKAGIMEIADIFVVNKADLPGADLTCLEIEKVLDMAVNPREWRPPVIQTVGTQGEGIREVWEAVKEHQAFLDEGGRREERRREQIRSEMADLVLKRLSQDFWSRWDEDPAFNELVKRVSLREMDHYAATELMVNKIKEAIKDA